MNPMLLAILAIVLQFSSLCFAESDLEKAMKVLDILEVRNQTFSDSYNPEFDGVEYTKLMTIAVDTSPGMRGWVDWALSAPPPSTEAMKRSGRAVLDQNITRALANKVGLFVPEKHIQPDLKSEAYQNAREALDFAFEVLGVSKTSTYHSDQHPRFSGLLLYELMLETYLHADTNTFVNPRDFVHGYANRKKQNLHKPLGGETGIEPIQFQIDAYFERYGSHMSQEYVSGLFSRASASGLDASKSCHDKVL